MTLDHAAQAAADREAQHVMCLCGHDRAYHLLGRGACIKVVETGACCRCKDFMWMRDLYVRAFRQGWEEARTETLKVLASATQKALTPESVASLVAALRHALEASA